MRPSPNLKRVCERAQLTYAYVLQAVPTSEVPALEAHIASCPDCQRELESLTHAEAAARLKEPIGTIKSRIHSGLHELRQMLTAKAGKP